MRNTNAVVAAAAVFTTAVEALDWMVEADAKIREEIQQQHEERCDVMLHLADLHSQFLGVIELGWTALKARRFNEVAKCLNEASRLRREANDLADEPHKIHRTELRALKDALNHLVLSEEAERRKLKPAVKVQQDPRQLEARRLLDALKAMVTGNPWLVLEKIAEEYVLLIAFYEGEMVQLNEQALSQLDKLERELRDTVLSLLANNKLVEALATINLPRFAGCTNREELASVIADHRDRKAAQESTEAGPSSSNGGTHASPKEHLRRGHYVTRGGKTFWRRPHLVNSGRVKAEGEVIILSAPLATKAS